MARDETMRSKFLSGQDARETTSASIVRLFHTAGSSRRATGSRKTASVGHGPFGDSIALSANRYHILYLVRRSQRRRF